jgi:hypothetical protein
MEDRRASLETRGFATSALYISLGTNIMYYSLALHYSMYANNFCICSNISVAPYKRLFGKTTSKGLNAL